MLGQTYLYYITSKLNICLIFEFMSSNVLVFCYEIISFLVPLTLCNCCVLVWFMVLNATFNNISVISWWSVLLVEETRVTRKTTDLSQVTDKLYHIMLYQVHLAINSQL
jgi:hypothetical protein